MEVYLLKLGSGRQYHVGIIRSVGKEQFMYYGEEVFPEKPGQQPVLVK